ncbi:hypothetical protein BJ963_003188 [Leifsonia soli]|uniref:Uncharacterized protein n=1 Tax=Leifsonia soli TaxID=582665 RepID=A0A852T2F6_9MICO|nr:hypothetical protein [Leifsonia soli]NYD75669.1 hypothetical protein [Leifsonia soli]
MMNERPSLPAPIKGFARFVLDHGFEVQRKDYDESFNSLFLLVREACTVTILQDRGAWHIDVGRRGQQVRFADWQEFLTGRRVIETGEPSEEDDFYRRHWAEVVGVTGDEARFSSLPTGAVDISAGRLAAIKADYEARRWVGRMRDDDGSN